MARQGLAIHSQSRCWNYRIRGAEGRQSAAHATPTSQTSHAEMRPHSWSNVVVVGWNPFERTDKTHEFIVRWGDCSAERGGRRPMGLGGKKERYAGRAYLADMLAKKRRKMPRSCRRDGTHALKSERARLWGEPGLQGGPCFGDRVRQCEVH